MERTEMRDSIGLTEADYKRLKIKQKVGNLLNAKLMKPTYIAKFGRERTERLCAVRADRLRWMDECNDILSEDFADFFKSYTFTPPERRRMTGSASGSAGSRARSICRTW